MRNALKSALLVLALLACAVPLRAGDGVWTLVGPPGTRWGNLTDFDEIVLDPHSPSTLYLVYFGERSSGVWKSTDSGGRWTSINPGIFSSYVRLAPDPFTPGTLYALAGFFNSQVLRKSTDGGRTWVDVRSFPAGGDFFFSGLAADPRIPGVLWAWGSNTIHRSDDGGVTWSQGAPIELGFGMAFHPTNPDVAYFAGRSALWQTADRGATWQTIGSFKNSGFFTLQIAPTRPSTMYARSWDFSEKACLRSDNGGLTWTRLPLPGGYSCTAVVVDDEDPRRVWALAENLDSGTASYRLYGSRDGGETWKTRHTLPSPAELSPWMLRREPTSGAFYILGSEGVYQSVNGGATWQVRNQGIAQTALVDFLALPGPGGNLLASTVDIPLGPPRNLLRSRTRGRSIVWNETSLDGVLAMALDPRVPGRIVAGTSGQPPGLYESRNRGITWSRVSETPDAVTSIAFHPIRRDRILIGTANSGIFLSDNGGRTWQPSSDGLPFPDPCDSTVCPAVDTVDITVDSRHPFVVHAIFFGRLVRSVNGGRSWSVVSLPGEGVEFGRFKALAQDSRLPEALYAAADSILFKSLDHGETWVRLPAAGGGLFSDLAFDPRQGGILYVATSTRGILRSRDGGATFEPLNQGLPIFDVNLLEIDPNVPGGLFAGTNGAGIWQGSF